MLKLTIWQVASDSFDHQLLVDPSIAKQREVIDTPMEEHSKFLKSCRGL